MFQKYPPSIFFSPWFILPLKCVCQPSLHQQKRPVANKIIYCRIEVINNSDESKVWGFIHTRRVLTFPCELTTHAGAWWITSQRAQAPPQLFVESLVFPSRNYALTSPPSTVPARVVRYCEPLSQYVTTVAVRHHRDRASPAVIAIFPPSFFTRMELLRLCWVSCGVVTFTSLFYLSLSIFLSSAFSPRPLPPSLYPSHRFIFSKLKILVTLVIIIDINTCKK